MAIALFGSAQNSGTTTTATVTLPASVPDGAVMLAAVTVTSSATPSITNNASWQLVRDLGTPNSGGLFVAHKIYQRVAASEPGSYSFTVSHSVGAWITTCAVYTGVDTTTPVASENCTADGSNGTTVTTPSISNADAGGWRVESFSTASTTSRTWTINNGDTERHDLTVAATIDNTTSWYDSNAAVAVGSYAAVGTVPTLTQARAGWIGFLEPIPDSLPAGRYYTQAVRRASYY